MGGLLSLRNSIAVSNVSVPGGLGDESLRAKAGLGGRATGRLTVASMPPPMARRPRRRAAAAAARTTSSTAAAAWQRARAWAV